MQHLAIDLGARKSQVCVRSSDGAILEELPWNTATLEDYLKKRPTSRVVLESSSEAFAVADMAVRCGHEVTVVPAMLTRALGVGARGIKNDQRDARATSSASCQMKDLPSIHIPSLESREIKALCTSRESLVGVRTKLINTVRSWMRTQLITFRKGSSQSFPDHAEQILLNRMEGMPTHIHALLDTLRSINEQLLGIHNQLVRLAEANNVCRRLMTVPGVGAVTAARFAASVDDVRRFPDAHALMSYFGLTPGEKVTGFKGHRTHLTKAGQSTVRRVLVQAAWCAMRTRKGDPMVIWASKIAERRGRHIAAVALARKLAGILFAIWRNQSVYNPVKGALSSTTT